MGLIPPKNEGLHRTPQCLLITALRTFRSEVHWVRLIATSGQLSVPWRSKLMPSDGCKGDTVPLAGHSPARSVRHVRVCRGGNTAAAVHGNPATDRRPATEASTDMTPCIIAATGLNRQAPDSRRSPNDRFLASNCVSARSRTHRAPHPKTPNRVVGSHFRSKHKRATVFGGWGKSCGKSRVKRLPTGMVRRHQEAARDEAVSDLFGRQSE